MALTSEQWRVVITELPRYNELQQLGKQDIGQELGVAKKSCLSAHENYPRYLCLLRNSGTQVRELNKIIHNSTSENSSSICTCTVLQI